MILAALMIPVQVVLVPFYRTVLGLGLLNTRVGLVLAYTAFFLPFSVYLMTAFYRGLPRELLEAARMDGAALPRGLVARHAAARAPGAADAGHPQHALLLERRADLAPRAEGPADPDGGHRRAPGGVHDQRPLLAAGIVLAAAPIVLVYLVFQRRIVAASPWAP